METMENFHQYLKLVNNCDPSDPLLSETSLGKELKNIPLISVNRSDLNHLTQVLNLEQLIPTEAGLARDYRGLAERMGFSSVEIENCIKRSYNPTRSLIDAFIKGNKNVTLNDLLKLIEDIERFDVIDDIMPTLIKLATTKVDSIKHDDEQLDGALVPNTTNTKPLAMTSINNDTTNQLKNFNRLTIDDLQHSDVIIYDAFICFAPEDMEYARELIDFLEANDKTVAIADDLLPGNFEHDALVKLIDNRCRKVIIILTPNFSRSKECEFQQKFASEINIKAESPKIIPVLYEFCEDSMIPSMIKVLSKIDMTNQAFREWQLHKLIRSLSGEFNNETKLLISNNRNSFSKRLNQFNSNKMNSDIRQIKSNSPAPNQISLAHQTDGDSLPAITFSKDATLASENNVGPIVDIIQSESSGEFLEYTQSTSDRGAIKLDSRSHQSGATVSPSVTTNNPINWLKKHVTRRVWRNEPGVSTSTSQLVLLQTDNNSDSCESSYNQQSMNGNS